MEGFARCHGDKAVTILREWWGDERCQVRGQSSRIATRDGG